MVRSMLALAAVVRVRASDQDSVADSTTNPIRKVVAMLQTMQKKVESEGAKQQELFDKFMCYCKNAGGELKKSIADAEAKSPQVTADIEEAEGQKAQLAEDLKSHQVDRDAAKAAVADATGIREKESTAFAKESGELKTNIGALSKAITAVQNGMAGGFLQTGAAQVLKQLAMSSKLDILDADRQDLLSFLSDSSDEQYTPSSGDIVGTLKQIKEDMDKTLADTVSAEESAVASYNELVTAKKKEIAALTKSIEQKTVRVGELAVSIVQMTNDLTDTQEQLLEDTKFFKDMNKNCETKEAEWAEVVKTRGEELTALAETIELLSGDDALELFKKSLPAASAGAFMQFRDTDKLRQKALLLIRAAQAKTAQDRPQFDFMALAIEGKKVGFEKVLKMIDEMVAGLKTEQQDDEHKREYCKAQIDMADDKKKGLERDARDAATVIDKAKDGLASLKDELDTLEDGIKSLDKSVAEATELRKEENDDFTEEMSSNAAAKELLGFAMNRLNKFYNPKLYKAPQRAAAFVQISSHHQLHAPPAPEAPGAYAKSESGGVIGMIQLLVKDLDKETAQAEADERFAQQAYEEAMKDASEKRAQDSKALTEKRSSKAQNEELLESSTDDKATAERDLMALEEFLGSLHAECDWLMKYFDVRKEARDAEIDALGKAKAVLSGAKYGFLQKTKEA